VSEHEQVPSDKEAIEEWGTKRTRDKLAEMGASGPGESVYSGEFPGFTGPRDIAFDESTEQRLAALTEDSHRYLDELPDEALFGEVYPSERDAENWSTPAEVAARPNAKHAGGKSITGTGGPIDRLFNPPAIELPDDEGTED
jgi:hypothetical protein